MPVLMDRLFVVSGMVKIAQELYLISHFSYRGLLWRGKILSKILGNLFLKHKKLNFDNSSHFCSALAPEFLFLSLLYILVASRTIIDNNLSYIGQCSQKLDVISVGFVHFHW